MIFRLAIVVACYGLSVMGFMYMLLGALNSFGDDWWVVRFLPLLWLFAWACHVRMSYAWIAGRPIERSWARRGTIAGILSLLSPLVLLADPNAPATPPPYDGAAILVGLMTLMFLPCILLAIYLVRSYTVRAA